MKTPVCHSIIFAVLLLFAIAAATIALSQVTSPDRPSFAVASIKPNGSAGEIPGPPAETDDYFAWTGRTLKTLMRYAYRARDWQIEGGPSWIDSELWDVEGRAKAEGVGAASKPIDRIAQHAKLMLMLQSLLEDRFKLKIQRQTKQSPAYNLVMAKGGPKVKPDDGHDSGARVQSGTPPAWAPQRGSIMTKGGGTWESIEGRAVPIAQLINTLLSSSDRPIIDCTNLKGLYTFKIQWSLQHSGAGDLPLGRRDSPFGAAFFTAMQEQLGLRLEPAKAPVDFIIIKSVQKPLTN
jgi:uncharacterized protein (TIGR03435 family)